MAVRRSVTLGHAQSAALTECVRVDVTGDDVSNLVINLFYIGLLQSMAVKEGENVICF